MGIETATIAAWASAAGAVGGIVNGMEQSRKAKNANKPEAPPQALKDPDQQNLQEQNRMAAALGDKKGNSSTFLTGPSGVDASQLNLGKTTLLGQ